MGSKFQIQIVDFITMGVLLLIIGLVVLFNIDFTWGILCVFASVTCFYQANVRAPKPDNSDAGQAEG